MMQLQPRLPDQMVGHNGPMAVAVILLKAHQAARPIAHQFNGALKVTLRKVGAHMSSEDAPE
jgi:hypothetical protein